MTAKINIDIKQKLKQQAICNANRQDMVVTEPPKWIGICSLVMGLLCGMFLFITEGVFQEQMWFISLWLLIGGFIVSWIMWAGIFMFLNYLFTNITKGACMAGKYTLNGAKTAATYAMKEVSLVVQEGKQAALLEQKKQALKSQLNDLEIQQLHKRITELEAEIREKSSNH